MKWRFRIPSSTLTFNPKSHLRNPAIWLIVALSFSGIGCARKSENPGSEVVVAAASDLTSAFEELGRAFEQETGGHVTFSFGSTGTLTQQIENGAPIDLFAAANIEFIERLEREDLIIPDSKSIYARGRVTIWTRQDSQLKLERIEDLADPGIRRVAIANPEHAPYGAAGRQAIEAAGLWRSVEPKLVLAENVRQAMQFAESGNADVAITALSLSVQSSGRWVVVPEELHKPLDQALAIIKTSKATDQARRFAEFVNEEKSRKIMRKYGFLLPGETPSN